MLGVVSVHTKYSYMQLHTYSYIIMNGNKQYFPYGMQTSRYVIVPTLVLRGTAHIIGIVKTE